MRERKRLNKARIKNIHLNAMRFTKTIGINLYIVGCPHLYTHTRTHMGQVGFTESSPHSHRYHKELPMKQFKLSMSGS